MMEPVSKPTDVNVRRRVLGVLLIPAAVFPLLALLTYNWRDVSELCVPPNVPSSNLIGAAGNQFAYLGYSTIGLTIWLIPFILLGIGLACCFSKAPRLRGRLLATIPTVLSLACLIQRTGNLPGIAYLLRTFNMGTDAGGAIGYLLMDKALDPLIGNGGTILMAIIFGFSLVACMGISTIKAFFSHVFSWALAREDDEYDDDEKDTEDATTRREAVLQAREQARLEREAEKERAAEERERKRAEKEAAQAAKRAEKEAREQAKLAEREAREAEQEAAVKRLREAREAAAAARAAETGALPFTPTSQPIVPPAPQPSATNTTTEKPVEDKGPYELPPITLLNPPQPSTAEHGDVDAMGSRIVDTLAQFGVESTLAYAIPGPVVTQYALSLAPGTKMERVTALYSNLQGALEAKSLRIQAPIPGKNAVGIEVPNEKPCGVGFGDVIRSGTWTRAVAKMPVPLCLGKDAAGNDLVTDLAGMPHLLVAGATGQGKSVCLNGIINGLLMCRTPEQLRLIMVDPKRVEFTQYNRLPHLLVPIVTDVNKVVFSLRWAVTEMDRRLKMFSRVGKRNIADFNARKQFTQGDLFGGPEEPENADLPKELPYIVIIIDEVADIMQTKGKEVEPVIARLTALARATGIHLILATQRPDAKIITGVIKSNIPGRIAFKTSSSIDSRTILDATGSEDLIGKGDMLFRTKEGALVRAQGSYISDDEIARVTDFIAEHANTQFDESFNARLAKIKEVDPNAELESEDEDAAPIEVPPPDVTAGDIGGVPAPAGMTGSKEEDLYNRALEVVRLTHRASTSHLQRRMGIGYNHAARLIDLLEDRGVIGPAKGAGPRDVLIDLDAERPAYNATPATTTNASMLDSETNTATLTEENEDEPRTDPEVGA